MERIEPSFYVYGHKKNPKPLDEGTALYCRIWNSDNYPEDFRWDSDLQEWCQSDYLWRLLSKGEIDLDRVEESEIPAYVGWPKFW